MSGALLLVLMSVGQLSYTKAVEITKNGETKPLIVMISADWCPGCVTLKGRLFKKKFVKYAYLNVDKPEDFVIAQKLSPGATISLPQLHKYIKKEDGTFEHEKLEDAVVSPDEKLDEFLGIDSSKLPPEEENGLEVIIQNMKGRKKR